MKKPTEEKLVRYGKEVNSIGGLVGNYYSLIDSEVNKITRKEADKVLNNPNGSKPAIIYKYSIFTKLNRMYKNVSKKKFDPTR